MRRAELAGWRSIAATEKAPHIAELGTVVADDIVLLAEIERDRLVAPVALSGFVIREGQGAEDGVQHGSGFVQLLHSLWSLQWIDENTYSTG